jgi:hypothetical protein
VDPVLGDDGRLYCDAALVPVFRDELAPLASLLTPNAFEAELLTGERVTDVASALRAARALRARGARAVVITSSPLAAPPRAAGAGAAGEGAGEGAAAGGATDAAAAAPATMLLFALCPWEDVEAAEGAGGAPLFSAADRAASPDAAAFGIAVPRLPYAFTGTGDALAALLLVRGAARPRNFPRAVEEAVAAVQAACGATAAQARAAERRLDAARARLAAADAGASAAGASAAGASAAGASAAGASIVADAATATATATATAAATMTRAEAERLVALSETGRAGSAAVDARAPAFTELALLAARDALARPVVPPALRAFSLCREG